MRILGIETSCDETSIAVLEIYKDGGIKIWSNIISSQITIHAKYGGVFPALAAREHAKNIDKVLKLALKEAGLKSVEEIDLVAVTHGPGLAVALIVGVTFAKTLAWKYKKPIVGVNHLEGHIYSNWLSTVQSSVFNTTVFNTIFPALNLIVSGGHTELVLMSAESSKEHSGGSASMSAKQTLGGKSPIKYKIIGETQDDAAGEAFDKIARLLELGYPGGPLISQEAEKFSKSEIHLLENSRGDSSRAKAPTEKLLLAAKSRGSRVGRISDLLEITLPRPMIHSKDFNFSFSGLKTAVLYLINKLTEQPSRLSLERIRPAIAHEVQQAIVDVLVAKTVKAAEKYKPKSILLSGGVSANSQLRINLNKAAEKMGIKYFQPELKYTGDNAAMIALAGYFNYANKKSPMKGGSWKSVKVDANLRFGKRP